MFGSISNKQLDTKDHSNYNIPQSPSSHSNWALCTLLALLSIILLATPARHWIIRAKINTRVLLETGPCTQQVPTGLISYVSLIC